MTLHKYYLELVPQVVGDFVPHVEEPTPSVGNQSCHNCLTPKKHFEPTSKYSV